MTGRQSCWSCARRRWIRLRSPRVSRVWIYPRSIHTSILVSSSTSFWLGMTMFGMCHPMLATNLAFCGTFVSVFSPLVIQQLYCSSVRPAMEYASLAWSGASDAERLERVQRRAARLISNISALSDTPHDILLARAGLQPLSRRRHIEQAVFAFRFVSGCSLPRHIQLLSHWLSAKPSATCRLRNADSIRLPRPKKNVLKASPLYISLSIWNNLSSDAKSSKSPRGLRSLLCRSI